jgi:hypothetical protein
MAAFEQGVTRYRLSVTGPVPRRLLETITHRFGNVSVGRNENDTVLDAVLVDQPSLRALLTLLWDAGHDVHDLSSTLDAEIAPAHDPRRP